MEHEQVAEQVGQPAARRPRDLLTNKIDIWERGGLQKLMSKLSCTKYVERGSRCLSCSIAKRKCDGTRPCKRCTRLGKVCADQPIPVDRPPVMPPVQATVSPPRNHGAQIIGTADLSTLNAFIQLGWQSEIFAAAWLAMPPKLKKSMTMLASRLPELLAHGAALRPPMPACNQHLWGGGFGAICKSVSSDGTTIRINPNYAAMAGLSTEEFLARNAQQAVPPYSSQYRFLCGLLEVLLLAIGASVDHTLFIPVRTNWVKSNDFTLIRVRLRMFADGHIATHVKVSPEEYERGRALQMGSRTVFEECELSAHELLTCDLMRNETIEAMANTEEGLQKLNRLADRIVEHFPL